MDRPLVPPTPVSPDIPEPWDRPAIARAAAVWLAWVLLLPSVPLVLLPMGEMVGEPWALALGSASVAGLWVWHLLLAVRVSRRPSAGLAVGEIIWPVAGVLAWVVLVGGAATLRPDARATPQEYALVTLLCAVPGALVVAGLAVGLHRTRDPHNFGVTMPTRRMPMQPQAPGEVAPRHAPPAATIEHLSSQDAYLAASVGARSLLIVTDAGCLIWPLAVGLAYFGSYGDRSVLALVVYGVFAAAFWYAHWRALRVLAWEPEARTLAYWLSWAAILVPMLGPFFVALALFTGMLRSSGEAIEAIAGLGFVLLAPLAFAHLAALVTTRVVASIPGKHAGDAGGP